MTNREPYQGLATEELTLRDRLAMDRTRLANERTLLAYLRSGVALMLAGVSFIYFAQQSWLEWLGLLCIPVGAVTLLFGVHRYRAVELRLRRAAETAAQTAAQTAPQTKTADG